MMSTWYLNHWLRVTQLVNVRARTEPRPTLNYEALMPLKEYANLHLHLHVHDLMQSSLNPLW